jgi:hypothetical protein
MAQTHDPGTSTQAIKHWFAEHGVPQFLGHYSCRERAKALVLPLVMVLAVQIGAATWFDVSVVLLLVVPPAMVVLALLFKRAFDGPLGLGPAQDKGWWLLPLWLLATVVTPYVFNATVALGISQAASPWFWPEPWLDTAVVFTALLACMVLNREDIWDPRGRRARLRWWLAGVVVATVVFSALEGSLFPPLASSTDPAAMLSVPQTLPSLLVVVAILTMSLRLALASPRRSTPRREVAVFVPAVPLLVVAFGIDSALFSYGFDGWAEAVLPALLLLVSAAVTTLAVWRLARQPEPPPVKTGVRLLKEEVSSPTLRVWVPVFLLCYPFMVLLVDINVDVFGRPAAGLEAVAVTLVINAICLGVAWVIVGFGLDRVAAWALQEARHNLWEIVAAFASGLPLLLVFTAFFALTAETWEIVVEVGSLSFLALLALLLGLTAIFLGISSVQQLRTLREFPTWAEVRQRALGEKGMRSKAPNARVSRIVEEAIDGTQDNAKPPDVGLRLLGWLNAVLVLAVYQVLIFTPVVVGAFVFFLLLGRLAVPPGVAAEWVYGDGASPSLGVALDNLPMLMDPWTRVAVVLAVFSGLYLSVTVLSNKDQRETFFGAAEDAMRQRFAMRLALDEVIRKREGQPDEPSATAGDQQEAMAG